MATFYHEQHPKVKYIFIAHNTRTRARRLSGGATQQVLYRKRA